MRTAGWPRGTVAFLFTDVAGSTGLWERFPREMPAAYDRHDAILRGAVERHGGVVYKVVGDAFQAAFPDAPAAVAAALAAQRALNAERWALPRPLRVRMVLHLCPASPSPDGDYRAPALNRLGRLLGVTHGGQILVSAAIATEVRGSVPSGAELFDLGKRRLKDLPGAEHIYQLAAPGLPTDFPPLPTLDARPHDLPEPPSPLIGREDEVAVVRAAIRDGGARLVTLTGPGGVGKTRLAVAAAAGLVDGFADGVRWVPLAPLAGTGLVASTVATHLGVREEADRPPIETVAAWLRGRSLLLVLDNCEHLLDEVAEVVAAWLEAAPGLAVLATSRGRLRLRAERTVAVAPLAVPPAAAADLDEVVTSPAGGLLVERVRAAGASPGDADAPALAAVCRLLDGLPLAIELAAARVRLYPPQALLARLERRLGVLTGGARDLPTRQRTMRDAIAWSHDLLSDAEKTLFRRLAVFAGGATIQAAESVCDPDGVFDTSDGLAALVDQSLLRPTEGPDGEPRVAMLETIREYAAELLQASGEAAATRTLHSVHFLRLAEEAATELTGPNERVWLERLEGEHANLRAAMERLLGHDPEMALSLAAALGPFWTIRGHMSEGREWLERALREGVGVANVRAAALRGLGSIVRSRGDYGQAAALLTEAAALSRELGDQQGVAEALHNLADTVEVQGGYERAAALQREALALSRKLGNRQGIAASLTSLGHLAQTEGDYGRASELVTEALTMFRELGNQRGVAHALGLLANLAEGQGDLRRSAMLHEESLALSRALGDKQSVASALGNLGNIAEELGDHGRAAALLEEALILFRELGHQLYIAASLTNLGNVTLSLGDYVRAASLHEEALALFQELGARPGVAASLDGLGLVAHAQGNFRRAEALLLEAVTLGRELGDKYLVATSLYNLGNVAWDRGDCKRSAAFHLEALAIREELGDQAGMAQSLEGVALVAIEQGYAGPAARLCGASSALREALNIPLRPVDRAAHVRALSELRKGLGPAVFTASWESGRALSVEQMVAEAHAMAAELAGKSAEP